MALKLFIQTFGCQMNEYDSRRIADAIAAKRDVERVDNAEQADLLIMNTCSVRDKAQEKVFSLLGRWRQIKESRDGVLIGVGGCVASQEGELIRERAPFVDVVFGPQTLHRVPELLESVEVSGQAAIDVSFPQIEKFDSLPEARADGPTAFVSIMEGCSKFCSFCVVPYTRGDEISREFDDVMQEVAGLAGQGVREITLLGQNVNAYRGAMADGEEADLALLIDFVAAVDGIDRVRFTTSHPAELGDSLIESYANVPELAGHLHLPVQSGADRILALMKRGYKVAEFEEKCRRLKAIRPDLSIGSDFIVGFPGETDEDFEQTMALVRRVGFDQSFSFVYSQRPGTPAVALPDDVPMETKKSRLHALQALLREQAEAISRSMLGSEQMVLFTGPSAKGEGDWAGRTPNNRVVNVPAGRDLTGQLLPVMIDAALPNSLRGRLV